MAMADRMESKLKDALAPEHLEIVDESHRHEGHAGWQPGGETHFRVEVVAAAFEGKSRVDRQRMIYEILAEEMAGGIHALALKTVTPAENGGP